jgi:acetolactate synthase-1/2/3 large subunit
VDTIFSLSGNQVLPLYDTLHSEGIRLITTRHEATAVHMADVAAQITRTAQVALVTAGPGHTNALTALGVARANEAPVLLLSGAADKSGRGTHAFQEFPQAEVAEFFTKWSGYADVPAEAASLVSRAMELAEADVPGPVSLSIPYDVQHAQIDVNVEAALPASSHWTADSLEPLVAALHKAERPIILASPWVSRDPRMTALSEAHGWPVFAIESPRGAADPFLIGAEAVLREADCIVLLAPWDFSSRTPDVQHARALGIIQVWPETGSAGQSFLPLRAGPVQVLHALEGKAFPNTSGWARQVAATRTQARERIGEQPLPGGVSGVNPFKLGAAVRRRLTAADYVTMDGGEFVCWLRLAVAQGPWRTSCNGKYGPIGPAFPYALGARAALGNGPAIIAFAGDGGFGYHAMDIETAVRERLPVIAIVGTDGLWAAEWHLQAKHYGPDRRVGTELGISELETMAAAHGALADGHGDAGDRPGLDLRPPRSQPGAVRLQDRHATPRRHPAADLVRAALHAVRQRGGEHQRVVPADRAHPRRVPARTGDDRPQRARRRRDRRPHQRRRRR